jgi:hypothetical protein
MIPRSDWLVVATVCDCNNVAVTIMDGSRLPDDYSWADASPEEIGLSGLDWRPLAIEAAGAMARRTGLLISPCCTVVAAGDDEPRQRAIENEASEILYPLQDAQRAERMTRRHGPGRGER